MPDFLQMTGLGLAALNSWILYKIVANHMTHHTEAANHLTNAINLLIQHLKNGK